MKKNHADASPSLKGVPIGKIVPFKALNTELHMGATFSTLERQALRILVHCASLIYRIDFNEVRVEHISSHEVENAFCLYAKTRKWPSHIVSGARTVTRKLGIQGLFPFQRSACNCHPVFEKWLNQANLSDPIRKKLSYSCVVFCRWLVDLAEFRRFSIDNVPLPLIQRRHVLAYRRYLFSLVRRGKLTGTTAKHYLQHLIRVIKGVQRDFHTVRGLEVAGITLRDSESRERVLPTQEQIAQLFYHLCADSKLFPFLLFHLIMLCTGARPIELTSATTKHLDYSEKSIWLQSKGGPGRWMPIGEHVWRLLMGYLASRDASSEKTTHLFHTHKGVQMHYEHCKSLLRKFREQHGLHIDGLMAFRHRFATDCLEHGLDPFLVCYMLGHSSTDQLRVYQHVRWKGMKAATNAAFGDRGAYL